MAAILPWFGKFALHCPMFSPLLRYEIAVVVPYFFNRQLTDILEQVFNLHDMGEFCMYTMECFMYTKVLICDAK